jgi:hypothetical protein
VGVDVPEWSSDAMIWIWIRILDKVEMIHSLRDKVVANIRKER